MSNCKMRVCTGTLLALAAAAAFAPAGCNNSNTHRVGAMPVDLQDRVTRNLNPALRGTIGEYAVLADSNPIPVEGYGVVAYLPKTGSGDADPRIRDLLVNQLVVDGIGFYSTGTEEISPEKILTSNEIAVVEVRGMIPPLARKGTTFDLFINALPDSGTTSLANGLLWTSDLKIRGLTLNGDDSATIAKGRGSVFIPAPLEAAAKGKPDDAPRALRTGRVLAGGVVAEDRLARIQLRNKNAALTKMMERVINARFPNERDKVADALDDSVVNLRIPKEYADNPMDMISQIMHLYLTPNEPGFLQVKAKQIIDALQDPEAPHQDLGLSLQGLGRSILPDYIQPYYTSSDPELRFWCARAGALMQDVGGMVVLEEFVKNSASPYRRLAILALIEASRGRDTERATVVLSEMLRSLNTEDRILAYHALLAIRSHAIATYSVGHKFVIDVVPADSPPLIYVLEAESPRIAFIGRPIELPVGATFVSHDNLFTVRVDDAEEIRVKTAMKSNPGVSKALEGIVADQKDSTVTLYWRTPLGDKTSQLRTNRSLPALVARATWVPDANDKDPVPYIGATYQRVSETLAEMVADKTIDASIVVEHTADLVTNPTDAVLSGRPAASTKSLPKTPAPLSQTPEAGAPPHRSPENAKKCGIPPLFACAHGTPSAYVKNLRTNSLPPTGKNGVFNLFLRPTRAKCVWHALRIYHDGNKMIKVAQGCVMLEG